jgi:hypothetical protein
MIYVCNFRAATQSRAVHRVYHWQLGGDHLWDDGILKVHTDHLILIHVVRVRVLVTPGVTSIKGRVSVFVSGRIVFPRVSLLHSARLARQGLFTSPYCTLGSTTRTWRMSNTLCCRCVNSVSNHAKHSKKKGKEATKGCAVAQVYQAVTAVGRTLFG